MTLRLASASASQEGLYSSYKALGTGTQMGMDWHIQHLTVNQWQTEKWPPVYSVIARAADSFWVSGTIFFGREAVRM